VYWIPGNYNILLTNTENVLFKICTRKIKIKLNIEYVS